MYGSIQVNNSNPIIHGGALSDIGSTKFVKNRGLSQILILLNDILLLF